MAALKKINLAICTIFLVFAPVFYSAADTASDLQQQQDQKAQLEAQLKQIEDQIAQYQQQLSAVQSQSNTLQHKITQLKIQQKQITLQINETNLNIQNIEAQLGQTQSSITQSQQKINQLKSKVAQVLQQLYIGQQTSTATILLSSNSFGDFFDQLNNYQQIGAQLDSLVSQVNAQLAILQDQQQQLSDQQQQQQNFLAIQVLQNQQLAQSISDQNSLLAQTRGREATYQSIINDKQAQADAIKNRIYELFDSTSQVTFGQAVQMAQWASQQTGVRAAFLLAILTQESNLGKNVGTCNRAGDPPSKSWKVVMKPDRDQQPFLQITSQLGLDPNTTPVSCPMYRNGVKIGWGGAMGPAQFIPSTWLGYQDKVSAITGKTADPWDIRDAFIAAAIKLKASGGDSVSGEWAAAMIYFSGSTNTRFRFYGDSVVATAAKYQSDINNISA